MLVVPVLQILQFEKRLERSVEYSLAKNENG